MEEIDRMNKAHNCAAILSAFFLSFCLTLSVTLTAFGQVPLGRVYFNFGWERKSLEVFSRDDAVAKIKEVLARCAYQDSGPYDRNLFCSPTKIELSGLGPENAEWVAKQITGVKVGW